MRFGTFQLHSIPPWTNGYDVVQQQFDQMVECDRQGFYELWLAEHNGRPYGAIGNTVAVATGVAAATKRIRIATAVSRLPLHHPTHLAEDLAYADIVSGGRIDWGVGKGYDKLEFATYGVDFEEREDRWQETFDAVNQMWRTGSTEFHGKFYDFPEGTLVPLPLQRPTLPIYVMVSGSERSIKLAADGLLPIASGSGLSPEELRQRLDLYAQMANAAGHSDTAIREILSRCWQLKPLHVGETTERAIVEYRRGLEWYMGELANRSMFGFARDPKPYEYFVEHQSVLLGSPEKIAEDLADYCDRSGIDNVICWINMGGQPHSQVMNAIQRMGEYVIPKLTDHTYGWTKSYGPVATAETNATATV